MVRIDALAVNPDTAPQAMDCTMIGQVGAPQAGVPVRLGARENWLHQGCASPGGVSPVLARNLLYRSKPRPHGEQGTP